MLSTTLLTVDAFWEYVAQHPLEQGYYELSRGVVEMAGGTGGQHGEIGTQLAIFVGSYVREQKLGRCTNAETCYVLSAEAAIVRCPDFAFVTMEHAPQPLPPQFVPFAPDLAVEVKSPSDSLRQLRRKCEEYLSYGVRLVWLILPETRQVEVYRPDQDILIVMGHDPLLGYDVLPSFSLPTCDLFPR